MKAAKNIKLKPGEVLVLRTNDKNNRSYGGFQWKKRGPMECPDWEPTSECGYGLHGLLWGQGDGLPLRWEPDALWQVLRVEVQDVVDLGGKVKFPRCHVVYTGDRTTATQIIYQHAPIGTIVVGLVITAGNRGQATAGYLGQATAGDYGHATAGYRGQATAGDYGHATAGYLGQATAGDYGQATAGYRGQATAGDYGRATAGDEGQATAGHGGILQIVWLDKKAKRYRVFTAYVGEEGIKANTPYRLDDEGKFVEVKE
jgi:hypothetical protein